MLTTAPVIRYEQRRDIGDRVVRNPLYPPLGETVCPVPGDPLLEARLRLAVVAARLGGLPVERGGEYAAIVPTPDGDVEITAADPTVRLLTALLLAEVGYTPGRYGFLALVADPAVQERALARLDPRLEAFGAGPRL